MENILELGDGSMYESKYREWFENTKTFVEMQCKHAVEMLRFEDNVKANEELYKTATAKSLKTKKKTRQGYTNNQCRSYLNNMHVDLLQSIILRQPMDSVKRKLDKFKKTISEFSAVFCKPEISKWKSILKIWFISS